MEKKVKGLTKMDDQIYRQAAIKAVHDEFDNLYLMEEDGEALADMVEEVLNRQPSAESEPLTDTEQRIFLAAMSREKTVCKLVDEEGPREPYEKSLVETCHEIIRKVKGALWT